MLHVNSVKLHRGFSLLEVLVSVCIVSLGVISIAKLQLVGIKDSDNAMRRSVALTQLTNMAEILHANPPEHQLPKLINSWNQENARLLPLGRGEVNKHGNNYRVVVNWEGLTTSKQDACNSNDKSMRHCVQTTIEI